MVRLFLTEPCLLNYFICAYAVPVKFMGLIKWTQGGMFYTLTLEQEVGKAIVIDELNTVRRRDLPGRGYVLLQCCWMWLLHFTLLQTAGISCVTMGGRQSCPMEGRSCAQSQVLL